jgi:tetratricopeptide (TPR) repeat protein
MVAKKYSKDSSVAGMYADVADAYRLNEAAPEPRPTLEAVNQLYKAALELDIQDVQTYYSAGMFYASTGDVSEAERCFARACRLDRSWAPAALSLARIYEVTDRLTDRIDVLDLAIRHGCREPQVVWLAGLGALGLGLWDRCVAYLQLHLTFDVSQLFTRYYLSLGLLKLAKYDQCIEAIEAEFAINPEIAFAAHSVKAYCFAKLERVEEANREIDASLEYSLSDVESLNEMGLSRAMERVRRAALELKDVDRASATAQRALRCGLASKEYFQEQREQREREAEVKLFEVAFTQELPENWKENPDCPLWEQSWLSYKVIWLVFCEGEGEAKAIATGFQRQCADSEPELVSVDVVGDRGFLTTEFGVIDVSPRDPIREAEEDSSDDSEDLASE